MTKKHSSTQRPPQPRQIKKMNNSLTTFMVLAVLGVAIIMILLLKEKQQPAATTTGAPAASSALVSAGLPAEQLDQALAASHPTLVFMHSTDCIPCKEMTKVVEQVYPEFANQIVLVDVNVYDRANTALMERLGLRVIPTTVFIDRKGQAQQVMGVMEPDALRETLGQLAMGG
ncbi:thioredoxin family protein [Candidatus Amarolinea aalborgensis]|jgi:thiol:disulfide interchange protein|uniref:thioredoxin family protein n=1 Tax=Candidatus Amarolinea aalborgensis TaxID=2249329 RepID=UPI003BF9F1B0